LNFKIRFSQILYALNIGFFRFFYLKKLLKDYIFYFTSFFKSCIKHHYFYRCAQCFRPFPDGVFYEFEGYKYCEHDFHVLFAPCCGKCGKIALHLFNCFIMFVELHISFYSLRKILHRNLCRNLKHTSTVCFCILCCAFFQESIKWKTNFPFSKEKENDTLK